MFRFEQDNIIIERVNSTRLFYFIGGTILTLSSTAGLVFSCYLSLTKRHSIYEFMPFALLFAFVFVLGLSAIMLSGSYKLVMHCSTGNYHEEETRFGKRLARNGPLSDFSSLKITPLKNKDAGCVINLCRRARPLFPIQLKTYYDYSEARTDLNRISVATGIPVEDAAVAAN